MAGLTKIQSDGIGDDIDFDGEGTLVLDSTNNRVGIGTSSPVDSLHVAGNIRAANSAGGRLLLEDSGQADASTPFYLVGSVNGDLTFTAANRNISGGTTGSTERLRIDSLGRVGIGTTSPNRTLDVKAASASTYVAQFLDSAATEAAKIYVDANGIGFVRDNFDDGIEFASNTARIYANGSERMRINSTGDVGIGTTSPVARLDVRVSEAGAFGAILYNTNSTGFGTIIRGGSTASQSSLSVQNYDGSAQQLYVRGDGNVGIGTTSPARPLHVSASDCRIRLTDTDSPAVSVELQNNNGSGVLTTNGATNLQFQTNNAETARIDSSGRLLVGTSSARSDVKFNATDTTPFVQIETATNSWNNGLSIINNSAQGYAATLRLGLTGGSSVGSNALVGQHQLGKISFHGGDGSKIREAASISVNVDASPGSGDMPGRLVFSTTADGGNSPTERMRINDDGRVGIGVTPDSQLHVVDANDNGLRVGYTGNTNYYDAPTHIWRHPSGFAERMRINSSGNVLIGTTGSLLQSARLRVASGNAALAEFYSSTAAGGYLTFTGGGGTPTLRGFLGSAAQLVSGGNEQDFCMRAQRHLAFATAGASERIRIENSGAVKLVANTNVDVIYSYAASTGTTATCFRGGHSATPGSPGTGTDSVYIFANGNIQNTNGSYGTISDIKLKENIVDASSQWDDFKAVRFRKYNFKEETGNETHTQLGVVAQELESTSPGLVYETVDKDQDGNDLGTTTKAVRTSVLTMKALVALQEAMKRIETLEAEVAALKSN